MALTEPYEVDFLSDRLCVAGVSFDIQRNDEMSGSGDGRMWQAQLARPLWRIDLQLFDQHLPKAREINAKVRALNGTKGSFLFNDPTYTPSAGSGAVSGVTISGISTDRTRIALAGLPANHTVAPGDRLGITYQSGRRFFAEFAEPMAAGTAGNMPMVSIFPYLPLPITDGATVNVVNPRIRVFVPPGGFTPFSVPHHARWGTGASLSLLQRV